MNEQTNGKTLNEQIQELEKKLDLSPRSIKKQIKIVGGDRRVYLENLKYNDKEDTKLQKSGKWYSNNEDS